MGWNFVSDKTQQPHISSTLLGVAFETDPDTIMRLTPEKRGAYIDKIDEALKEGVLTSPQALSIVSKIIWASAVFDNPAEFKHFLAILKRRAYAKPRDSSMSEEIREALLAIRNSLQCSQPKKIPDFRFSSSSQSELNGEHYCIYSDAMQSRSPASLYLEDERLRMGTGGTLFHPASIGAKPWAFNDRVSQSDLREMTERETQILNAELLAVKRSLEIFGPRMDSSFPVLWFIDNQAAFNCLCWGDSHSDDTRAIVRSIFQLISRFNLSIWWEWCESEANNSDVPSRYVDFAAPLSDALGGVDFEILFQDSRPAYPGTRFGVLFCSPPFHWFAFTK